METFDDFFSNNKEQFDSYELPSGHEQRFMKRLQQRNRYHVLRVVISSAASVAVIIGLTALMAWFYHGGIVDQKFVLGLNAEGAVNAEIYYNSLLNQKYREVEKSVYSAQPELSSEVVQIMKSFEVENEKLRSDLLKSQKKDYMVGIMVQSYQTQIDILDRIQSTIGLKNGEL